jgi:hypothetical protein
MDSNRERMLEFSVGKKLDRFFLVPEEAGLEQEVGFDHGISRKAIEVFEVKESEPLLEGRTKSPLGKSALHRHLAPLKPSLDPPSGTGLLAFGPLARSLPMA